MDSEKLLAFHEKLYYHELESREKLTARLQLCLGVLTILVGLMIYMVAHFDGNSASDPGFWAVALLVTYLFGLSLLISAAVEFVQSLWPQSSYEYLPYPKDIESYRSLLLETYAAFDDGSDIARSEYEKFLLRYMTECSSANAALNAKRYENLHNAISYIVYSVPFISIAGLAFVVGGFMKQGSS